MILLIGCSFGFFILQKDSPHDHFENPFKSIVKVCIFMSGRIFVLVYERSNIRILLALFLIINVNYHGIDRIIYIVPFALSDINIINM